MKYTIKSWSIREMYKLIKDNKINLRPSYQRNFVWNKKDQQLLIDSILNNWPLPTFFLYKHGDGMYEMVDGQQRAETICRFIKGSITDSLTRNYNDVDSSAFLSYSLNITEITEIDNASECISDFYALVNKRGKQLNIAEVNKAQYANHPFLKLSEELLVTPEVSCLNIFTNATITRMNDRSLIEELLAYLFKGIFDKRDAVNEIYQSIISEKDILNLKESFIQIITRIGMLNSILPIKDTRFKQRNDFFTLFTYINKHIKTLSDDLLQYQYNLLCWIDENKFIRPSNDDCELLQKYAFACVTQSNSKNSRLNRLDILETILLHKSDTESNYYEEFLEYLRDEFNLDEIPVKDINGYSLIDYMNINISNDR